MDSNTNAASGDLPVLKAQLLYICCNTTDLPANLFYQCAQPKVDPSQPPQKDPEANTHDHDSTGASPVSVMYKLLPVMCLTVTIMSLTTEDIGNMFAHVSMLN